MSNRSLRVELNTVLRKVSEGIIKAATIQGMVTERERANLIKEGLEQALEKVEEIMADFEKGSGC